MKGALIHTCSLSSEVVAQLVFSIQKKALENGELW